MIMYEMMRMEGLDMAMDCELSPLLIIQLQ